MSASLVVLAAGIGSRYGGLKQVDGIGPSGEAIVDYSVYDAVRAGFDRVVFVIRPDIEGTFRGSVGARIGAHVAVDYAFQDTAPGRKKPFGTGHAVLAAASKVQGAFAVINADDYYGRSAYASIKGHLDHTATDATAYCMAAFRLHLTLSEHGKVSRGICRVDTAGFLQSIIERTGVEWVGEDIRCEAGVLTGKEPVSMNMWGFKDSIFGHLQAKFDAFRARQANDPAAEFYLPEAVGRLVREKAATVRVIPAEDAWFGITNPGDRDMAKHRISDLVRQGCYPERLWA